MKAKPKTCQLSEFSIKLAIYSMAKTFRAQLIMQELCCSRGLFTACLWVLMGATNLNGLTSKLPFCIDIFIQYSIFFFKNAFKSCKVSFFSPILLFFYI